MSEIEQLEQRVSALAADIEAFKSKDDSWPSVGDELWLLNWAGSVLLRRWEGVDWLLPLKAQGNLFRTLEEAYAERDARYVEVELKSQPGCRPFVAGENVYNRSWLYEASTDSLTDVGLAESSYGLFHAYYDTTEARDKALATVGLDRVLAAAKWRATGVC